MSHNKLYVGVGLVALVIVMMFMPMLDTNRLATRFNVRTVVTQIESAATAEAGNLYPDAYSLSSYLDSCGVMLKKVWGRDPQILGAIDDSGLLDPSDQQEHRPGDIVLYSSGSSFVLWYFDKKNQMKPVYPSNYRYRV